VRRAPQAARGSRARTAPPLRRARSSHESRRRLDESQPLRSARSSSLPSLLLPTETKKETDDNKDQASRYLIFFLQRRGRVECSAGEHEQEITRCYAQALTEGRGSEGEKRERCVAGGGGREASERRRGGCGGGMGAASSCSSSLAFPLPRSKLGGVGVDGRFPIE
jgi:hypothetical protein